MDTVEHHKPTRGKADRRGRLLILLLLGVGGWVTVAWIAFLIWLLLT